MWSYIIVGFIIFIIIGSVAQNSEQKNKSNTRVTPTPRKPKPALLMLDREGDAHDDEWFTYIAGVPHHITKNEIGSFLGWVQHDQDNKYDPYAMGVYDYKGKLIGYIPAKEVKEYRAWCDARPQPCAGFTYIENGQLRGRVKAVRPCNPEFIQNELQRFLDWAHDHYGYVPKTAGIEFEKL